MATPRASASRSAIGALLDAGAAATEPSPRPVSFAPTATKTYRKRQVLLDPRADATLQALTDTLQRVTGTRLTTSHAARAVMHAVEPILPRLAASTPPRDAMSLPNNAARFAEERARFERALRHLIGEALRSAG